MKRVEIADTVYYGEVDENELPSGVGLLLKPGGGTVLGTFAGSTTASVPFLAYETNGDVLMLGETVGTIFFASSGERYEGDFISGEQSGFGVYSWSDGTTFSGQFMKGKPHGFGMLQQRRGVMILGEFIDGQSCGFGSRIHRDVTYQGGLRNGKRNGFGSNIDGRNTIQGEWKDDEIITFGDCNGQVDEAISRALQAMNRTTGAISIAVQQTLRKVDTLRIQISKLCMQLNILRRKYNGSSHLADIDRNLNALAVALETRAGPDAIVHSLRADVSSPQSENSGRILTDKSSPSSLSSIDHGENPAYYQAENSAIISTMRGTSRGEAGFFTQEGQRYTRSQGDVVPSPVTHVKKILGQEIRDGSAFFYDDAASMHEDEMLMKEKLYAASFRNDWQIQHGHDLGAQGIVEFETKQEMQSMNDFREKQGFEVDANRFSRPDSRTNVDQYSDLSVGYERGFNERSDGFSGSDSRMNIAQVPNQFEAGFHEQYDGGFDERFDRFSGSDTRTTTQIRGATDAVDAAEQYAHGFGEKSNWFSGSDSRRSLLGRQKPAEFQQGPFYGELAGTNAPQQALPWNAGNSDARRSDFAPHFIHGIMISHVSDPRSASQPQVEGVIQQRQSMANLQRFEDADGNQSPREETGEFRQMVMGQHYDRIRTENEGANGLRNMPPYEYGRLDRAEFQDTNRKSGEAFEYNKIFQTMSSNPAEMAYSKRSSGYGYESLREQEGNVGREVRDNEQYSVSDFRFDPSADHIGWNQAGGTFNPKQGQAEGVRYSGQFGLRVSNAGPLPIDTVGVQPTHPSSIVSPLGSVQKHSSPHGDDDDDGFERIGQDPSLVASTVASKGGPTISRQFNGILTGESEAHQHYRELKQDATNGSVLPDPNLLIVSGVGRSARRTGATEERPLTMEPSRITSSLERRPGMGSYAELMISSEHWSESDDVLHRVVPSGQRQDENLAMLYSYKDSSSLVNPVGQPARSSTLKHTPFLPLRESAPDTTERRNSVLGPEQSAEKGVVYAELMRGGPMGFNDTRMGKHGQDDMKIIRGISSTSRSYLASDFQPLSAAQSDNQMQAGSYPSYNLSALETGNSAEGALLFKRRSFSSVLGETVEKDTATQVAFGQLNYGDSAFQTSAAPHENVNVAVDHARHSSLNLQSAEPSLMLGRKDSAEASSSRSVHHQHPVRDDSVEFEPLNPGDSSLQKSNSRLLSTISLPVSEPISNKDITLVQATNRGAFDQVIISRRHRARISRPDDFDATAQDSVEDAGVNPGFSALRREGASPRTRDQMEGANQLRPVGQDEDQATLEGAAFVNLRKGQVIAKDDGPTLVFRGSAGSQDGFIHLRREEVRTMRSNSIGGDFKEVTDVENDDNDDQRDASFFMLRGTRAPRNESYAASSSRDPGEEGDFGQSETLTGFITLRRERESPRNRDQGRANQSMLGDQQDQEMFEYGQQSSTFVKLRRDQASVKDKPSFMLEESDAEGGFTSLRTGVARIGRNTEREDNFSLAGDEAEGGYSNNKESDASFITLRGTRRKGEDARDWIAGNRALGELDALSQGDAGFTMLRQEQDSSRSDHSRLGGQYENQYTFEAGQQPSSFIQLQKDRVSAKDGTPLVVEGGGEGDFVRLRRDGDQITRSNDVEGNTGEEDSGDINIGQSDPPFFTLRGAQRRGQVGQRVDLSQIGAEFTVLRRVQGSPRRKDQATEANQSMLGNEDDNHEAYEASQMPSAFVTLRKDQDATVFKIGGAGNQDGFMRLRKGETRATRQGDFGDNSIVHDDGDYYNSHISNNQPDASFIMLRGPRGKGQGDANQALAEEDQGETGFAMLRKESASPRRAASANQAMLGNAQAEDQDLFEDGQHQSTFIRLRKDQASAAASGSTFDLERDVSEVGLTKLSRGGARTGGNFAGDDDRDFHANDNQPDDSSFIMLRGARGRKQERQGEHVDDLSHRETEFTMLRSERRIPRRNNQSMESSDQDENQTRFQIESGDNEGGFTRLRKEEAGSGRSKNSAGSALNGGDVEYGDLSNNDGNELETSSIILRGARRRGPEGRDPTISSRTLDGDDDVDFNQGETEFTMLRRERTSPRQAVRPNPARLGDHGEDQEMFEDGQQSPMFIKLQRDRVSDKNRGPFVIEGYLRRGDAPTDQNRDLHGAYGDRENNQPDGSFIMLRDARNSGQYLARRSRAVGEDVDQHDAGFTMLRRERAAGAHQSVLGDQDIDSSAPAGTELEGGGFTRLQRDPGHELDSDIAGNFVDDIGGDGDSNRQPHFTLRRGFGAYGLTSTGIQGEDDVDLSRYEPGFTMLRREQASRRRRGQMPEANDKDFDQDVSEGGQQPSTFVRLRKDQVLAKDVTSFPDETSDMKGGFTRLRREGVRTRGVEGADEDEDDGNFLDNNDNNQPDESFVNLRSVRRRGLEGHRGSSSHTLDEDDPDVDQDGTGFTMLRRGRASPGKRDQAPRINEPNDESLDLVEDGQQPSMFVRLRKDQVSSASKSNFMGEGEDSEVGFTNLRTKGARTKLNRDIKGDIVGSGDEFEDGDSDDNQPDSSFFMLRGTARRGQRHHDQSTGDLGEDVDQDETGFTMLRRDRAFPRKRSQDREGQDEDQDLFNDAQHSPTFVRLRKDQASSTMDGFFFIPHEEGEDVGSFTRLRRGGYGRIERGGGIEEGNSDLEDVNEDSDHNNQLDASVIKSRGARRRGHEPLDEDADLDQGELRFTMLRRERLATRTNQVRSGDNQDQDQVNWQDAQQPSTFVRLRKDQVSSKNNSVFTAEGGEVDNSQGGFSRMRTGGARTGPKSGSERNFANEDGDYAENDNHLDSSFIMLQGARKHDSHTRFAHDPGEDETGFTMLRRDQASPRRNNQAMDFDGQVGENQELFEDGQRQQQPSTFVKLRRDHVSAKDGSAFFAEGKDSEGGFTELQRGRIRNERKRDNADGFGAEEDNFDNNQQEASFIMLQGTRRRGQDGLGRSDNRALGGDDADLNQDESGFTMLRRERASPRSSQSRLGDQYEDEEFSEPDQQPSILRKLRKDQAAATDRFAFMIGEGLSSVEGGFTRLRGIGARSSRNSELDGRFGNEEDGDDNNDNDNRHPEASFIMLRSARGGGQQGLDEGVDFSQSKSGFTMLRGDQASLKPKDRAGRTNESRLGHGHEDVFENGQEPSPFIPLRKDQVLTKDGATRFAGDESDIEGGFTRLRRGGGNNEQNSAINNRSAGAYGAANKGGNFSFTDLYAQQALSGSKHEGQDIDYANNKMMLRTGQTSQKHPSGGAVSLSSVNSSGQNQDEQSGVFGNLFKHSINGVLDHASADSSTILRDLELAQSTGTVHARTNLSKLDGSTHAAMGPSRNNNARLSRPGLNNIEASVDGIYDDGQDWDHSTYADFRKHLVNSRVMNPASKPMDDNPAVMRNLWLRQLGSSGVTEPSSTRSRMLESPFISDSLALVENHSPPLRANRSVIGQLKASGQESRGDSFLQQHLNAQSAVPFSSLAVDPRNQTASLLLSEALQGSGLPTKNQMGFRTSSSHSLFERTSFLSGASEREMDSEEEDEEEEDMNLLEASFEAKANFEDVRLGVFARRPRKGKTKIEKRGETQVMHAQEKRECSAAQEFAKPPPPPPLLPPKHNPLPPPAED